MIRFWTLGRIDLEGVDDASARSVLRGSKRLGLLAYLVIARPAGYRRRERLLGLLWPESEPDRARHALRNTLYELRRALGSGSLPGRGQEEVGVDFGEVWCDAVAFRRALEDGEDARALELYEGELLPGLHVDGASRVFEEWLEGERGRLRRRAVEAARRLAEEADAAGSRDEAVEWSRRAASLAPYDEAGLRQLMEALARAGRPAESVRAYEDFVERASSELGLRPGPETRALAASIRAASGGETGGAGAPGGPEAGADPAAETAGPSRGASAGEGEEGRDARGERSEGQAVARGRPEGGGEVPRGPAAAPSSSGWRILLAAAAAALLAAVGLVALRGNGDDGAGRDGAVAPPGQRVAVFPFAVRGNGDTSPPLPGGGLATLLAAGLDGAAGLRVVDQHALRGRPQAVDGEGMGVAEAAETTRALEAGLFVLGDAVVGADRVHLSAALHRPGGTAALARASVEGERDRTFRLVDRLAAELLADRYPADELPLVRQAARTTSSLSALKSYLRGEEQFRAGRFASAVDAYQRSVAADSDFALAHHRLSITAEWLGNRSLAREGAERAVRLASRLPERHRMLLAAHEASLGGDAGEAEERYREILASYPNDLEAWYQLGEILFHYGPAVGRSVGEARRAFEEVLALSPEHVPSLVHLARIAASEERPREVSGLAGRVLELVPGSTHAWEMRALQAHAGRGDDRDREELLAGLRDASDRSVRLAAWNVAVFAEDPAAAAPLARLLTAPWRSPGARRLGREWTAELSLARGRWRRAREVLEEGPVARAPFHAHREAVLAALPFVRTPDSALAALRERLASGEPALSEAGGPPGDGGLEALRPRLRLFTEGVLRSRAGDEAGALARARELEATAGGPAGSVPLAERLGRIVRAHVRWGRGDPRGALRALGPSGVETRSSLMYGVDYVQPYERYLRARLLEDAGRPEEALRWLGSFRHQHVHHLVYLGPSRFRRARVLEALGDTAAARRHYRGFLELWRDPDPALRPMVRRAEKGLRRLAEGAGRPAAGEAAAAP